MTKRNIFFILKKIVLFVLLFAVQNVSAKEFNWSEESAKRLNWYKAKAFCEKQDARLPTYKEIKSVWLDNGKNSNISGFDLSVSYWTSTEAKNRSNAAHPFYFGEGKTGWYYKNDHYGVRCIKN